MDQHIFVLIAQLSPLPAGLTAAQVQRIPSAPLLERLLFEQPLILIGLCIILGVAGAIACVRRGKQRRAPLALAGGLVLAGAIYAIASAVETDREKCMQLTRDAVKYVTAADTTSLAPMLRSSMDVKPFGLTRDGVLALVPSSIGKYGVKSSTISSLTAVKDSDSSVRTQVHVRVMMDATLYEFPTGSWWIITWQRSSDDAPWLIAQIECQQIDGVGEPGNVRP
jgi:hypothetical protein